MFTEQLCTEIKLLINAHEVELPPLTTNNDIFALIIQSLTKNFCTN